MLGSEEEAEDALQDAFCRLWPRSGDINSESEAEALLTTTVRRLSIDNLRRRETARRNLEEMGRAAPDEAEEPDETAQREARFREVEAIIAKELSPLAQTILRRHEYEGESIDHIATDLQMQATAVRMHLSRARKTIRSCYQKQMQS